MGEAKRRKDASGGARQWTPNDVQRILMDPRAAGVGGYPAVVDNAQWVAANVKLIESVGADTYLTVLLDLLHEMGDPAPVHYLVLTRFSYSEPGHSSNWIAPFEVDCEPADLPRLYRAWVKTQVADEGVNERHYGHKKVIGAFEAVAMPVDALDSAIKGAYADLDADEAAADEAASERAKVEAAEYAAGVETREREEFARLSSKFAEIS